MDEQIVGQADSVQESDQNSQATVLMSLEKMIKKYLERLESLRVEIKKHREMYDDGFVNNPTFRENKDKATAAAKDLQVTRKNIASQPGQVQLYVKIKGMRDEMREMKASLSDYLIEYGRMTGATQLELFSGEVGDIVLSAKVVKRSRGN